MRKKVQWHAFGLRHIIVAFLMEAPMPNCDDEALIKLNRILATQQRHGELLAMLDARLTRLEKSSYQTEGEISVMRLWLGAIDQRRGCDAIVS